MWKPLVFGLIFWLGLLAFFTAHTKNDSVNFHQNSFDSINLDISLTNDYGDGFDLYPFSFIAATYLETNITAIPTIEYDDAIFNWEIDGAIYTGKTVQYTFKSTGIKILTLSMVYDTNETFTKTFEISSHYVRREIRSLTDKDRESLLTAMEVIYFTETINGKEIYGDEFKGIDYFMQEHLNGAGQMGCDHWHDDAGIMTHHLSFTLEFENALRVIDPSLSVPYWDYTIDRHIYGIDWGTESPIFADDWFSPASSDDELHAITEGRWAYLPVLKDASAISSVYNPYDLLRSPWNTNPLPYVTRYNKVLRQRPYSHLPSCEEFNTFFEYDWIGELNSGLNGELHGPVHIMLGGHWNSFIETRFDNFILGKSIANILLISKNFWRTGYARCPTNCTNLTMEECQCSCPSQFTEGLDAYEVLNKLDQLDYIEMSPVLSYDSDKERYIIEGYTDAEQDKIWSDLLQSICSFGHAGEMFTSAAPYDPTFWLIHTSAERFLQYRRFSSYYGTNYLNETWGYSHESSAPSDFGKVCEWNDVADDELPKCRSETCFGHHSSDYLPQSGLIEGKGRFTNEEFYSFIDPRNPSMPYIYDNFNWDHCVEEGVTFDF